ncbi:TraU family protein [Desulfurobacterium sp. TC5-1]|uniref:TraU family protein n=1 Tax=Desulfurobacterium sp. TC5-1 TaxID=1158318 RepID=UPI00041D6BD7|nr:TraU family protein [Desulfurobacterium sp. TC5-1]
MKRFLIFLVMLLFPFTGYSMSGFCPVDSAGQIMSVEFSTISNMLPVRIGYVTIAGGTALQADMRTDYPPLSPLCFCIRNIAGVPVPTMGIIIGYYSPLATIETVKIPGCFPTFGLSIPLKGNMGTDGSEDSFGGVSFFEVHYVSFNVLKLLSIFTDLSCTFSPSASGMDIGWISEFDPTWHNEQLAAYMSPESLLFANPIAQMACMADGAATTAGIDIDVLYWCSGGASIFPLSGFVDTTSFIRAASLDSAKMIFKLTRQGMLWDTTGLHMVEGRCAALPAPIWEKSNYSQYPIFPGVFPHRFPLGMTDLVWGKLINLPFPEKEGFIVFQIYQKRDCCAL